MRKNRAEVEDSGGGVTPVGNDLAEVTSAVASASMLLVVRRGLLTVVSGVSTVLIARLLGLEAYGGLQAALATWGLFLAGCDLGFTLALSRDFALAPWDERTLLRTAFELQGAWSVLLALFLVAVSLFSSPHEGQRRLILLILAASVPFMAFTCGRVLYGARLQNQAVVKVDLACNIVQVIAMITAAALGGGPVGVAIAISVGTAANACWVGIIAYRTARGTVRTGRTRSVLIRRVIPLGVMGVLSKVYLSIDLVILGFMITGPQLGSYAAAVKLVTLANTLPGLLMASALPGMAAVFEDVKDLSAFIGRLLHWQCAIALPIFGFIAVFAPTITVLALGTPYRRASSLVTILCAAGVVGLISQVLGTLLVAANRVRALLVQNTVAVVLNVALNLLLIRRYGATACAWITVGTEVVVCMASLWTVRYTLRLRPPLTQAGRAAIATVVAVAAGLAAFRHPLVGICGYTFFYFFMILALRAWPPDFSVAKLTRRRR